MLPKDQKAFPIYGHFQFQYTFENRLS